MDCVITILTGAVSKIGEVTVGKIGNQFGYVICHNKRITKLREEHEELKAVKLEILGKVDAGRRNGLHTSPPVLSWLHKVEITETELERFYEDEKNTKSKWVGGWCPNLVSHYSLGRKATKMTDNIVGLKQEKFDVISYSAPPPELGNTFTQEGIFSFESRREIVREIIENLKDDKLGKLSTCGMGGVGKTTLVKEVIKIIESNKIFDHVAMAVVSLTPNYHTIQGQISETLGYKLMNETVEGRAVELYKMLKDTNQKMVIVLGDVWEELDFERIGLPSWDSEHRKGCKVIFTSRDEQVCRMMGSQKNFNISVLSDNEAWNLFREMAGVECVDKPHIHSIATQVVKECGGLPLALVSVGKALKNKEKPAWQDALLQLRNSQLTSS